MTDLTHIKTFILTAELRSLAKVARKLGISPAAVSKQLTKLEMELGVQLLIRSTRKIELTEIGISYSIQCRKILEEVDAANSLVSNVKATPNGTLKVVSGRHFATSFIVPYIKEFLTKYPKIELDLELAERIPDLNSEGIDIMIGMSIPATGEAIQRRIGSTSYVLAASPEYLKKFGIPKTPSDLKDHRYITHSMRKPDNELSLGKEIVTLSSYIKLNDTQTMLQLALEGLGIVNLHRYVVEDYLKKGTLKEILVSYNKNDVPLYVAYPQRRYVSSKVRCFIDFITEKIKTQLVP
jgi:DNA-binding transcriptional LysR family regulator